LSELVVAFLVVTSAAFANDGMVLETPSFRVTLREQCGEGVVGCDNVEYRGTRKRDRASIVLRGRAVMVMCKDGVTPCHIGYYLFRNGRYEYVVYPEGRLIVRRGTRELLSEAGDWH
jgi:hypothetical protein